MPAPQRPVGIRPASVAWPERRMHRRQGPRASRPGPTRQRSLPDRVLPAARGRSAAPAKVFRDLSAMARKLTTQTETRWMTDGTGRRFGGRRFTRRMPRLRLVPWPIALVLLVVLCLVLGQVLGEFAVAVFRWLGRTAVRAL